MEEVSLGINKLLPGAWARPCDTCKSTVALLFCRPHALFLCLACDDKLHAPHAHHARVWVCEVCEQAPAAVTCKADVAILCAACDRDIHAANPLSRRHERVPVVPFFDTAAALITASAATDGGGGIGGGGGDGTGILLPASAATDCSHACFADVEPVPSQWDFPVTGTKVEPDVPVTKGVDCLFTDTDQFIDFDCTGTDSVVPVQSMKMYEEATAQHIINQLSNKYMDIDFSHSKLNSISHNHSFAAQSICQSISSPSMDVGVVPDKSSMSDISYPYIRPGRTTVDPFGSIGTVASQGPDREARVLRYREKRKNRKFEKTIRYASRKAYAESRPRIKGRFAKRTETEPKSMNQIFISNSSVFMFESNGFGIVPSF